MPDVDFTEQVELFYDYLGLDISDVGIDSNISEDELNSVIEEINVISNTYELEVADVNFVFNVMDNKTIVITFADYSAGEYGWINGVDPEYGGYTMDAGIHYFDLETVTLVEEDTDSEVDIDDFYFDTNGIYALDAEGDSYLLENQAYVNIELGEELQDGETYVLELPPIALSKEVKGAMNIDVYDVGAVSSKNVYFPESQFEFVNNSAKEFAYSGDGNDTLEGIIITSDIWNSWNDLPVSATAYSQDGRALHIDAGDLEWSIVEGDGSLLEVEDLGFPGQSRTKLHFNNVDTSITIRVEYHGLENEKTLYYVGGNTV